MKRFALITSTVFGIPLFAMCVGSLGIAGGDSLKDKKAMVALAKVTIEQAIKTASEKVPGTVIEAELEPEHKKIVWEVEVLTPEGKLTEVHVDAETGTVLDIETKGTAKKKKKQKSGTK